MGRSATLCHLETNEHFNFVLVEGLHIGRALPVLGGMSKGRASTLQSALTSVDRRGLVKVSLADECKHHKVPGAFNAWPSA